MEKRKKGKEAAKKLFSENASPQIGSPTRAKKYPIFVGSIPIPSSKNLLKSAYLHWFRHFLLKV
jgi:hypothetical protein